MFTNGTNYKNNLLSKTFLRFFDDFYEYTRDALGDVTYTGTYDSSSGCHVLKQQSSASFDALGRKIAYVSGVGKTTTMTYDNNGNLLTVTDPLSHTTTYTYDALNRRIRLPIRSAIPPPIAIMPRIGSRAC